MKKEDFDRLVGRRFGESGHVLVEKAKDYASGTDRLHNFKQAASAMGTTPERALWGMYMKHFVSVQDMVLSEKVPSQEWIDEKIGDSINYHILLEGLFMERLQSLAELDEAVSDFADLARGLSPELLESSGKPEEDFDASGN